MPFHTGERLTLTIDDIAFGGEGVGRVDDFVVFVPFVLVGEVVCVQLTEVKKHFARAKLLDIEKSSPERIEPACRYFGQCGGCQYQHITYPAQLRLKQKQIGDLFERVGKFPPGLVGAVIPCPQPYGYRNRIMVRSQWNKPEQKLNIGFVRWDCGLVEDIEECNIAEPALNEQLQHVRTHPPPRGGLKVVLRSLPENWDVPPDSFFQNNFFLLPKLVEVVRSFLRGVGDQASTRPENGYPQSRAKAWIPAKHLIDLYCGVGFLGIELADAVESFAAVEYDQRAIKSAQKNAATRQISNGHFISAKVEEALPDLLKKFPREETAILLDPPRKGCLPATLKMLRETRPAQIIYVSCHPATMARDLGILCGDGLYDLACVQPLDMFPQTQHVECVADLRAGEMLANQPAMDSTERTR